MRDVRYEFCWACQRPWKCSGSVRCCGNDGCDGTDPRIRILAVAETMTIDGIRGCPSIRACPRCGLLINLTDGCRHMTCKFCKAEFCFICLRRFGVGHSLTACAIAPVQTTLVDPMWEQRADNAHRWCVIL